ncbi:hypothetical protein MAAFP003_3075 [Mycobacterium ahvazicum]|uniref:Uncharacterized protein n=1 Tax=Mycobacterium ahvazicum TaxID=1964395 RepID=A0A2K4YC98_9MYCO|nr:hypothetical protein [Mycobacterium ahvazicum]SOX54399.1 hypothetical protein MAAFP003_3075 [Mycobacterium ahvazicum]
METFTLDPRHWSVARIFGRNALLRRSDRMEALVTLIAFVVSLMAIPFAGVAAGITYGVRDRVYVQQAHQRHTVTATITQTSNDDSGITLVQAKWPAPQGERTGQLELADAAALGDRTTVWVDMHGDLVTPPTPTWQAVGDAFAAALGTVLVIAVGVAALVISVRSRLHRARDAQWGRELSCLQADGGKTIP